MKSFLYFALVTALILVIIAIFFFYFALVTALILVIIAIFFYIWKKSNKMTEMFIDNTSQAYKDAITSVYQSHMYRKPTEKEIRKYTGMIQTPNDTTSIIVDLRKNEEFENLPKNL
jgi:predicted negative regulator of RcsB-dependent stress response